MPFGDPSCGPRCAPLALEADEPTDEPQEQAPPPGLRERDWDILKEVAKNSDGQVGFQGIRRRLDLHPEALRRSLRRLVEDGYVTKTDIGYALGARGVDLIAVQRVPRRDVRPMPVAFLLLPSHVTPDRVVAAFTRRWFDGLHWYGLADGSGETTLTWLTTDGTAVRLRVGLWGLRIEAVVGEADPDDRLVAAAPIVAAVADLLRAPARQASKADAAAPATADASAFVAS